MPEVKPKAKPKTKRNRKPNQTPKITKAMLEKAIVGTGGIVQQVAQKLGRDWHTVNKWIEQHGLQDNLAIELEKTLDLAETQIVRAMQNGDVNTCKWFLGTKGKQRGYVERTEVDDRGARQELDALRAHINAMIINASTNPNTNTTALRKDTSETAPSSK